MKYDHPEIIDPALDVIKATDPDTWERMTSDDTWHVTVVTEPGEASIDDFLMMLQGATGLTNSVPERENRYTHILMLNLTALADTHDTKETAFVADTLVHEFYHHEHYDGPAERGAYAADVEFARKMAARDPSAPPVLEDALWAQRNFSD